MEKFPLPNTLVITTVEPRINRILPEIIQVPQQQILWLQSYGPVITHPYGCLVRNVIMSLYHYPIAQIYIAGEWNEEDNQLSETGLQDRLVQEHISKETWDTVDYVLQHTAGRSLCEWLRGADSMEENIRNSVWLLQTNPLLPNRIPVYGMLVEPDTGRFLKVTNEKISQADSFRF